MNLKTPGVYVRDASPVLPPVALIETGLPAFIGYTERAADLKGNSLENIPMRVKDLGEFEVFFGGAYRSKAFEIAVDIAEENKIEEINIPARFYLHESLRHFFDNGGGDCFIISIGSFVDEFGNPVSVDKDQLLTGLAALEYADDPDLVLFPDAVALKRANGSGNVPALADLYQKALRHNENRNNRFLIADIIPQGTIHEDVEAFRNEIGIRHLKYGAVYYPWIYTNYNHEFHLCEFDFNEKDNKGRLIPIDPNQFTSQQKTDGAAQQRALYNEAKRWNDVIKAMLNLTGIPQFDREDVSDLEQAIYRNANSISTDNATELSNDIAGFFELVRPITKSFALLDGGIPVSLQAVLMKKLTADALPDQIEQIIAWEKSESVRRLIDSARTEEEVIKDYDDPLKVLDPPVFSGSPWINELTLQNIPAEQLSGSPQEIVQFIQNIISKVAVSLANSLKGLFEEAFAAEAEAEGLLFSRHPFFGKVAEQLALELKKIPPSGTMAGIYNGTDVATGVWKAPANVRLQATLGPTIHIDDQKQENLNVHSTGKSVNVIRAITGRGTRVWGARTLDGNSLEWRYVPVRRYFNFIEEVVKRAAESFVFEPNAAATWVRMRLFLKTFLTREWRQGALNGDSPDEAFFINIGLGESMTEVDILEGRMIVEIGLAVVRPAEFIVVRHICRMEEV